MGQMQSHMGETLKRRRDYLVGGLSGQRIRQEEVHSRRCDLINNDVLTWA